MHIIYVNKFEAKQTLYYVCIFAQKLDKYRLDISKKMVYNLRRRNCLCHLGNALILLREKNTQVNVTK